MNYFRYKTVIQKRKAMRKYKATGNLTMFDEEEH